METAPAPRPKEFNPDDISNEQVTPQDPWAETATPAHASEHFQIPADHSGNLPPLPGISPEEEAARFEDIAHTLKGTEVITQVHGLDAQDAPTDQSSRSEQTEVYTPRHLRLNDEPFVANPVSDRERRNQENFKATVGLAKSLEASNPELMEGVKNYLDNTPLPPTPEQSAGDSQAFTKADATELQSRLASTPAEQNTPQPEQTAAPENYQGKRRKLGRIASWFAKLRS